MGNPYPNFLEVYINLLLQFRILLFSPRNQKKNSSTMAFSVRGKTAIVTGAGSGAFHPTITPNANE